MISQAVVLAGGAGTRLGALTAKTPKPLLNVGSKPFIFYLLDMLRAAGLEDVVILAGPHEEQFRQALDAVKGSKLRIRLVPELTPAGTAGALTFAKDALDEAFVLLNGDTYFEVEYAVLCAELERDSNAFVAIALRKAEETVRFGSVMLEGAKVVRFSEKRAESTPFINGGVYAMRRECLRYIDRMPCSLERDLFPVFAEAGKARGLVSSGRFIDIGIPSDFERAQALLPAWSSDRAQGSTR